VRRPLVAAPRALARNTAALGVGVARTLLRYPIRLSKTRLAELNIPVVITVIEAMPGNMYER
jgi:hypothetical protein